jgi:hypothetical protein
VALTNCFNSNPLWRVEWRGSARTYFAPLACYCLSYLRSGLGQASRREVGTSVGRLCLLASKRSDKVKSIVRCCSFDVCLIAPRRLDRSLASRQRLPPPPKLPGLDSAMTPSKLCVNVLDHSDPCSAQSRLLRSLSVIVDGGREWLTTTL